MSLDAPTPPTVQLIPIYEYTPGSDMSTRPIAIPDSRLVLRLFLRRHLSSGWLHRIYAEL